MNYFSVLLKSFIFLRVDNLLFYDALNCVVAGVFSIKHYSLLESSAVEECIIIISNTHLELLSIAIMFNYLHSSFFLAHYFYPI